MLGGALEDAPRFVFDQQVGGRPSARLVLEIDVGQRVAVYLFLTRKLLRPRSEACRFGICICLV
jgi:hypothetical protein